MRKRYSYLITFIILALIVITAYWVRSLPVKYGELNGLDEFYIYRMSEYVVTHNFQPLEFDIMRKHPFGSIPLVEEYIAPMYVPAILYIPFSMFINYFDYALLFPAIMGALAVLIMYFLGKEFYGKTAGIFSAFFVAFMIAFITRTIGTSFEKEALAAPFMLLAVYLFAKAYRKKDWRYGILSGLSLGMMGITWGGVEFFYLIFSIFALILLLLNKRIKKLTYSYLPLILIGILLPQMFPHHLPITATGVIFSIAIAVILIIRCAAERFKLVPADKVQYIVPAMIIIGIIGFLSLSMVSDDVYSILDRTISLIYAKQTNPIGFTVAENQPGDFNAIISSTSAAASDALMPQLSFLSHYLSPSLFMFLGFVIVLYRMFNNFNSRSLFVLLWFVSSIWAVFFAIRLMFIFGPSAALLSGVFFSWLLKNSKKIKTIKNEKHTEKIFLTFGMLFLLLIFTALNNIFYAITLLACAAAFITIFVVMKEREAKPLLKKIYDHIVGRVEKIDLILIPVILIVILTVSINVANAFVYTNSISPTICMVGNLLPGEKCTVPGPDGKRMMMLRNQPWYQAMFYLANNTPKDSSVISWWDFGYWFQTRGERNTYADGGQGDRTSLALWYTASTANWSDWEEWLIDNYSVDYILMDYTLPGKFSAISAIASGGERILGIAQFSPTNTYPQGNKTIYELSSGPYKIWVPYSNNTVDGNPVFMVMQGDQIVSKAYINHICTAETGILELEEKAPAIPGCLAFTNFGVFFVPEEAENTIFSSLMFMDGYGLPVEKEFDNGMIYIYRIKK